MSASYNSEPHSPLPLRTISRNLDKIHFKNQFKGTEELPRQRVIEGQDPGGKENPQKRVQHWLFFLPWVIHQHWPQRLINWAEDPSWEAQASETQGADDNKQRKLSPRDEGPGRNSSTSQSPLGQSVFPKVHSAQLQVVEANVPPC